MIPITEEVKKEPSIIWFITVFRVSGNLSEKTKPLYESKRCFGFYRSYEKAQKAILENWCDIYEDGYYNLALLEGIEEGLTGLSFHEWYSVKAILNEKPEKQEKSEDQPDAIQLLAFGIGPSDGPMENSEGWRVKGYDISKIEMPDRFKHLGHFSFT